MVYMHVLVYTCVSLFTSELVPTELLYLLSSQNHHNGTIRQINNPTRNKRGSGHINERIKHHKDGGEKIKQITITSINNTQEQIQDFLEHPKTFINSCWYIQIVPINVNVTDTQMDQFSSISGTADVHVHVHIRMQLWLTTSDMEQYANYMYP